MNYLLLSIIIVIFLKVIFKQKYEVKDLVFIVYYYAIMTMFHNKSVYQMILPVLSAFLIYSYIKKKYIFIKHSLFPAIVIQYRSITNSIYNNELYFTNYHFVWCVYFMFDFGGGNNDFTK